MVSRCTLTRPVVALLCSKSSRRRTSAARARRTRPPSCRRSCPPPRRRVVCVLLVSHVTQLSLTVPFVRCIVRCALSAEGEDPQGPPFDAVTQPHLRAARSGYRGVRGYRTTPCRWSVLCVWIPPFARAWLRQRVHRADGAEGLLCSWRRCLRNRQACYARGVARVLRLGTCYCPTP
jgi:hypothetical protein